MVRSWLRLDRHDLPDQDTFDLTDDQEIPYLDRMVASLRTGQQGLTRWDKYYRGEQPISFLAPEIKQELGDRLETLVLNLPRLALDTVEERLDIEGFRLPGEDTTSADLWRVWQASGMDLGSGRNHLRSLRHGYAFVSVWAGGKKGLPRIAPETGMEVVGDYYPGSTDLRGVVKYWKDADVEYANLALSNRVVKFFKGGRDKLGTPVTSWTVRQVLPNPLGVPPYIPFLNRYDEDKPHGESELADVVKVADAINKLGTDMMVTSEFTAAPRRYMTGIDVPKQGAERDRLREEVQKYLERATTGAIWTGGKDVNFGQFASADLSNYVNAVELLLQTFAALAGLPPHMVGIHGDNPASADAIRSSESSLIKRVLRKQRTFGEPWEDVMRLAIRVRDGGELANDEALETVWRSPETPTIAQKADAAVKLVNASIIDDQQAQEDLGYTPQQRDSMAKRRDQAVAGAVNAATAERVRMAMDLVAQGVDEKIAFPAVGLLITPKQSLPGEQSPTAPDGDPATSGDAESVQAPIPASKTP